MKRLIAVAGLAALAACTPPAGEDTADADEGAMTEAVEGAGTFDYSADDGSGGGRIVMNEDGTYSDTYEGETTTGKWSLADGKTCFVPDEEGATEACWTDSEPGEDGSFTSTAADGTTVTVTPVSGDDGEAEVAEESE